jgi:hypothetical protein
MLVAPIPVAGRSRSSPCPFVSVFSSRSPFEEEDSSMAGDKKADLAGPGISTYEEVDRILPTSYEAVLPPLERMKALYAIKDYIEKGLARNST